MITLFFFVLGFALGFWLRGTKAASWLLGWFKPATN